MKAAKVCQSTPCRWHRLQPLQGDIAVRSHGMAGDAEAGVRRRRACLPGTMRTSDFLPMFDVDAVLLSAASRPLFVIGDGNRNA